MDNKISSKFVEWQLRAKGSDDAKENKKDKKDKKKSRSNKIQLDSDSNPEASLLKCFFGDDKGVEDFRLNHFQRHPVVSRKHDITEVQQALFDLDIKELLSNTSSDQIHVWMKSMDSDSLNSITVSDPEQAGLLFQAGHSLYCRAPPHFEQMVVPILTKELSYGIDIANNDRFRRGEVEMFYSRKGHFTDFHTDFQENFTIQLSGVKKWIFASSTATHPIRGCTPHFNQSKDKDLVEQQLKILKLGDSKFSPAQFKDNGDYTEIILQAGDVMYHPAGVWHRVECLEDSISLNISLTAVSFADVFCCSLQQLLMENPLWRSSIFHEDDALSNGGRPNAEQIMKSLIESVPSIVKGLNPSDLLPFPTMRNKLSRNDSKKTLVVERSPANQNEAKGDDDEVEEEEDEEEEEMESEEEGSDLEELMEEIENDSDNEEESGGNELTKQLIVNVEDIDLTSCSDYFQVQTSSNESNSKKRKNSDLTVLETSFKFNPFAMILEQSLDDRIKLVVHCGYGNETLESASRAELILPAEMKSFIQKIILLHEQERLERNEYFQKINETIRSSKSVKVDTEYKSTKHTLTQWQGINSKLKNKFDDDDEIIRILYGLKLVGAISFL